MKYWEADDWAFAGVMTIIGLALIGLITVMPFVAAHNARMREACYSMDGVFLDKHCFKKEAFIDHRNVDFKLKDGILFDKDKER